MLCFPLNESISYQGQSERENEHAAEELLPNTFTQLLQRAYVQTVLARPPP